MNFWACSNLTLKDKIKTNGKMFVQYTSKNMYSQRKTLNMRSYFFHELNDLIYFEFAAGCACKKLSFSFIDKNNFFIFQPSMN